MHANGLVNPKRHRLRLLGSLTLHRFLLDFLGFFFFFGRLGGFLLRGFLAVLALAHDACSMVGKIENCLVVQVPVHYMRAVSERVLYNSKKT